MSDNKLCQSILCIQYKNTTGVTVNETTVLTTDQRTDVNNLRQAGFTALTNCL